MDKGQDQEQLPDTITAVAANGHLMEYRVTGRDGSGALTTSKWDARCVSNCGACADGEPRPNW